MDVDDNFPDSLCEASINDDDLTDPNYALSSLNSTACNSEADPGSPGSNFGLNPEPGGPLKFVNYQHEEQTGGKGGMTAVQTSVEHNSTEDGHAAEETEQAREEDEHSVTDVTAAFEELVADMDEIDHMNEASLPSPLPNQQQNMERELAQLQHMVSDIKNTFESAMSALTLMQHDDQRLIGRFDSSQKDQEARLTEVVEMVMQLKTEMTELNSQLQQSLNQQQKLEKRVKWLQLERNLLLEELVKSGALTESFREKCFSSRAQSGELNESHGSSSSLASLLDKARGLFSSPPRPSASAQSDADSGRDSGVVTAVTSSLSQFDSELSSAPRVESYIAGLNSNTETDDQTSSNEEPAGYHDDYESDASAVEAANHSLDLSQSLSGKCSSELAQLVNNDDGGDETGQTDTSKCTDDMDCETLTGSEQQLNQVSNHEQEANEISEEESESQTSKSFIGPFSRKIPLHETARSKEGLRQRVCQELLDTERKYCRSLWMLMDHFANPLQQVGLATSQEIPTMFPPSLERLYEHHCNLLQKLNSRLSTNEFLIGDLLLHFFDPSQSDLYEVYQLYLQHYPGALKTLTKYCRESNKFRRFLKEAQKHPSCEGLTLMSYFLTPVQRVPRYVLLLKQLVRYTDSAHPDYHHIRHTLQILKDFLLKLNDSMEEAVDGSMNGKGKGVMSLEPPMDTPRHPKRRFRVRSFRSNKPGSSNGLPLTASQTGMRTSFDGSSHGVTGVPYYRAYPRHLDNNSLPVMPRRSQCNQPILVPDTSGNYHPVQAAALDYILASQKQFLSSYFVDLQNKQPSHVDEQANGQNSSQTNYSNRFSLPPDCYPHNMSFQSIDSSNSVFSNPLGLPLEDSILSDGSLIPHGDESFSSLPPHLLYKRKVSSTVSLRAPLQKSFSVDRDSCCTDVSSLNSSSQKVASDQDSNSSVVKAPAAADEGKVSSARKKLQLGDEPAHQDDKAVPNGISKYIIQSGDDEQSNNAPLKVSTPRPSAGMSAKPPSGSSLTAAGSRGISIDRAQRRWKKAPVGMVYYSLDQADTAGDGQQGLQTLKSASSVTHLLDAEQQEEARSYTPQYSAMKYPSPAKSENNLATTKSAKKLSLKKSFRNFFRRNNTDDLRSEPLISLVAHRKLAENKVDHQGGLLDGSVLAPPNQPIRAVHTFPAEADGAADKPPLPPQHTQQQQQQQQEPHKMLHRHPSVDMDQTLCMSSYIYGEDEEDDDPCSAV